MIKIDEKLFELNYYIYVTASVHVPADIHVETMIRFIFSFCLIIQVLKVNR